MIEKKSVFVSFAPRDVRQRNLLKDHPLMTDPAFEFIDFPIKDNSKRDWQDRVLMGVRRARGVIVLVSANTLTSSGQKWEITCAKTEKKNMLAVWSYVNDKTVLPGLLPIDWSWDSIRTFIDGL
jgi:hypothetical protein